MYFGRGVGVEFDILTVLINDDVWRNRKVEGLIMNQVTCLLAQLLGNPYV